MLLLQTTNSKWSATYLTAAIAMTLSVIEGHFISLLQAFTSLSFCICGASRSLSACEELLVLTTEQQLTTFRPT